MAGGLLSLTIEVLVAMIIGNLMTYQPTTLSSRDKMHKDATLMKRGGIRRLPMVESGKLVGVLTATDVMKAF